jgi:hypothetical protein
VISVEFSHSSALSRIVETTNFGIVFLRSENLPV